MHRKKYYILGIGGVAMGNLAGLLQAKGHEVIGSDGALYEPMKSMLRQHKIPVLSPYSEKHIKKHRGSIFVIGNAIGRGNPELEYILAQGLTYRSLTDILREEFLEGKKPIVIAGTHGKTTTSALMAWILECAGLDPTIFIGGFTRNFEAGFKLGKGKYAVLEGDEYNISFFDRNPKILAYRPFIGLVNNIELDHVDIYKDIEEIKAAFRSFLKLIPKNGLAVTNAGDKNTQDVLHETEKNIWKGESKPNTISFHVKHGDFYALGLKEKDGKLSFDVYFRAKRYISDITTSLTGSYNVSNILGCIAISNFLKIPRSTIKSAIGSFNGVKRRAETIYEKNDISIIDDYAHHPTAVLETLKGIRNRFHGKRLVLFFEPGSASSKKRIFENRYKRAFSEADALFLYKPYNTSAMKKGEVFHGKQLISSMRHLKIGAYFYDDVDKLLFHAKHFLKPGDVGIVMSCRGFDGFREKLVEALDR